MTALKDAFGRIGVLPRHTRFNIAIAELINSGGTIEEGHTLLDAAAERMPGRGQTMFASDGQIVHALPRQQVEGVRGHNPGAGNGHTATASPSSFSRDGRGHESIAQRGHMPHASPVREPTASQRAAVARVARITALDTLKIDGRAIGDWTVGEARRLGPQKTREGIILMMATMRVANASGDQLIRDVLKADELLGVMQRAAEIADATAI